MKNAIILHGTGGSPDKFWFPYLKKELTKKGYKVSMPKLPHSDNPDITELLPYLLKKYDFDYQTVLIGHSSACPLILSLLENTEVKIKQAVLVSGFYKPLGKEKQPILQDSYDTEKIQRHVKEIVMINSDNDPWDCTPKKAEKIRTALNAKMIVVHEGHMGSDKFNQPYKEFPLLLELVD